MLTDHGAVILRQKVELVVHDTKQGACVENCGNCQGSNNEVPNTLA